MPPTYSPPPGSWNPVYHKNPLLAVRIFYYLPTECEQLDRPRAPHRAVTLIFQSFARHRSLLTLTDAGNNDARGGRRLNDYYKPIYMTLLRSTCAESVEDERVTTVREGKKKNRFFLFFSFIITHALHHSAISYVRSIPRFPRFYCSIITIRFLFVFLFFLITIVLAEIHLKLPWKKRRRTCAYSYCYLLSAKTDFDFIFWTRNLKKKNVKIIMNFIYTLSIIYFPFDCVQN